MMPDREKVKYSIERCISHVPDACRDCAYDAGHPYNECVEMMLKDSLALLKEQETVEHALEVLRKAGWKETQDVPFPAELLKEQEAVMPNVSSVNQRCGNCNKVIEMDGWKTCPWCGKPIDWARWWRENTNGVRHDG